MYYFHTEVFTKIYSLLTMCSHTIKYVRWLDHVLHYIMIILCYSQHDYNIMDIIVTYDGQWL